MNPLTNYEIMLTNILKPKNMINIPGTLADWRNSSNWYFPPERYGYLEIWTGWKISFIEIDWLQPKKCCRIVLRKYILLEEA